MHSSQDPSRASSSPPSPSSPPLPPIAFDAKQTVPDPKTYGHRLRSQGDNSQPSVPHDQSAHQDRLAASHSYSYSSSAVSPSNFTYKSRRTSRDSDTTLVASPYWPSSPSATSASRFHTCYKNTPVSMSEHTPYPPRSDSYQAPKNAVTAFPDSLERRPLIDFVTNDWQRNSNPYPRDGSFDSQDSYAHYVHEKDIYTAPQLPEWLKRILRIQVPRRVQRYLGGYLVFLLALWFGWLYWLQPAWTHEKMLDESAATVSSGKGQAFGVNMRPAFKDMIHMQTLDTTLLPNGGNGDRRLVFIGDVHGCKDERTSSHYHRFHMTS
jgi:hypothetical protein